METVELHEAYFWDCPSCGEENLIRAIALDPVPQDLLDIIGDMTDRKVVEVPEMVVCEFCKERFKADF